MMSIQEIQAANIERAASFLAHWVETTEPGRFDWRPIADDSSKSRSVSQIAQECITANRRFAAILKGNPPAPGSSETGETTMGIAETKEQILSSARELADVVRTLDEEAMKKVHQLPFGPIPAAALIQLCVGHTMYHGGQINYIQTLYGDTVFHMPGMPS